MSLTPFSPLSGLIVLFFTVALLCARAKTVLFSAAVAGTLCAFLLCAYRYLQAWPLMPMHWTSGGLLFPLALLALPQVKAGGGRVLLVLLVLIAAANLFFPRDYYLPFLRSYSLWAHAFLLSGTVARALLISAAARSFSLLLGREWDGGRSFNSAAAGYVLLTVSMFCGEIWSYLGWGTPVVWHDAAIAPAIALWFYWSCFLHLHYLPGLNPRLQAIAIAVGGVLTLVATVQPDLGPFRGVI